MDVYNDLGPGFLENAHREAMEIEVDAGRILSKPPQEIHIKHERRELRRFCIADLICYDTIIVETRAMDNLTLREEGQLIDYLKTPKMKVGLLVNFWHFPSLEWKRLVLTKDPRSLRSTLAIQEDSRGYPNLISAGSPAFAVKGVRIWGWERAYARSHPQIRGSTTGIPEEP